MIGILEQLVSIVSLTFWRECIYSKHCINTSFFWAKK